jgi:hypothetical protein
MNTLSHLWQYLAEFLLEWEMFQIKAVKKIQVSLKSDKNNTYFTWTHFHIYNNISLNSSWNEKSFR